MTIDPFKTIDLSSDHLHDQCIEIIVKEFKSNRNADKLEISLLLFEHLFAHFHADFKKFCRSCKLTKKQLSEFLSYLLYCIYYKEIPLSSFVDSPLFLELYLLTLLAETQSSQKIKKVIIRLPLEKQISLICHCHLNLREGSWAILDAFEEYYQNDNDWQSLLKNLKSKYYDVLYLAYLMALRDNTKPISITQLVSELENHAASEVKNIMNHFPTILNMLQSELAVKEQLSDYHQRPYTFEEFSVFFRLFGLSGQLTSNNVPASLSEVFEGIVKLEGIFHQQPLVPLKKISSMIKDLWNQLFSFHRQPQAYSSGLDRLVYTVPTRGSSKMPWLPSILSGLNKLIQHLQQKGLKNAIPPPIIIFDQANSKQFAKNSSFIANLEKKYDATSIWHLSRKETLQLAKKLGIENWIKTKPKGDFGYGGARNCALLLSPLIALAIRQGKKSIEEILQLSYAELKILFDQAILGINQHDSIVHMGEDDVFVPPCNIFLDALTADTNKQLYFEKEASCLGRYTMKVNALIDLKSIMEKPLNLYYSTGWNRTPETGGMKAMLTKPRFCLPLPFGNEESHVRPLHNVINYFQQPNLHLAGTRFPTKLFPVSPLDGMAEYLCTFLPYSIQICMSSELTNPVGAPDRSIFPWNDKNSHNEKSITSLGDLIRLANQPETQIEMRKRFWRNFEIALSESPPSLLNESLLRLTHFDPSVEAPGDLKEIYKKYQRDALFFLAFAKNLLQQEAKHIEKAITETEHLMHMKIAETTLSKNLLRLINCIETFNPNSLIS